MCNFKLSRPGNVARINKVFAPKNAVWTAYFGNFSRNISRFIPKPNSSRIEPKPQMRTSTNQDRLNTIEALLKNHTEEQDSHYKTINEQLHKYAEKNDQLRSIVQQLQDLLKITGRLTQS